MPTLTTLLKQPTTLTTARDALAATVEHLRSVNAKTSEGLSRLGIQTIEQLARATLFQRLQALVRQAQATRPRKDGPFVADHVEASQAPAATLLAGVIKSDPHLDESVFRLLGVTDLTEFEHWQPYEDALAVLELAKHEVAQPESPPTGGDPPAEPPATGEQPPAPPANTPDDGSSSGEPPNGGKARRATVTVVRTTGEPMAGLYLRALHIGVCDEVRLGTSLLPTDDDGKGAVEYTASGRVDLQVEAYIHWESSLQEVQGRSELVYDAKDAVSLVITVGEGVARPLSEFDEIRRRMNKVLESECPDHTLSDLTERQIELLSGKTELSVTQVTAYVDAVREASRIAGPNGSLPLSHGDGTAFDPAVLFALQRAGHPLRLEAFAAAKRSQLHTDVQLAIAKGVVAERVANDLDAAIEMLGDAAQVLVAHAVESQPREAVAQFLEIAGLSAAGQVEFLNRHSKFEGSTTALLEALRNEQPPELPGDAIDRVQSALALTQVSLGYLPLVKEFAESGVDEAKLVTLTRADVHALINSAEAPAVAPAGVDPAIYADAVSSLIELSYPTQSFAHRVLRSKGASPDAQQIGNLLLQTGLEFTRVPLALRLRSEPGLLGDQPATARDALLTWELAFRLSPAGRRSEVAPKLVAAGLGSPDVLLRRGKAASRKALEDILDADDANAVLERAAKLKAADTSIRLIAGGGPFAQASFAVTPDSPIRAPELGSWVDLLGSLDSCSCDHCSSVLSPGAYLADLLMWLGGQAAEAGRSLFDLLGHRRMDPAVPGSLEEKPDNYRSRRADIPHLELSCKNTHTPLPYLDIVNEQLEYTALAYLGALTSELPPSVEPRSWQTTSTEAELLLQPEHQLDGAYRLLAAPDTLTHPFCLPFDLRFEEAKGYLSLLDLSPGQLQLLFDPRQPSAALSAEGLAPLALGITVSQAALIATPTSGEALERHWGLRPSTGRGPADAVEVGTPTVPTPQRANTWAELSTISKLLVHASADGLAPLSYEALTDILRSRFVAGDIEHVRIHFADAACSLDKATLEGWDGDTQRDAFFDRLHRFLRLRQFISWTTHELDHALVVLGSQDPSAAGTSGSLLDQTTLVRLGQAKLLVERLKLTPLSVLAFWAPLNTSRPQLMPWREALGAGAFNLVFSVPSRERADQEVLPSFYETWAGVPARQKLPPEDARAVLQLERLAAQPAPLSAHASVIAATLGVSPAQLEQALAFGIDDVRLDQPLTLERLSALYRTVTLASSLALSVTELLELLRLKGTTTRALFEAGHAERLLEWVEEVTLVTRYHQVADLSWILRGQDASSLEPETETTRWSTLVADLGQDLLRLQQEADTAAPKNAPAPLPSTGTRASDAVVLESRRRDLIGQRLAGTFSLEPAVLEVLLTRLQRSGAPLIAPLLDEALPAFVASPAAGVAEATSTTRAVATAADFPAIFSMLRHLSRVASLLAREGLTQEEMILLLEHGPKFGWLALSSLGDDKETPDWAGFLSLQRALRLHQELDGQLFALLAEHQAGRALEELTVTLLAWPSNEAAVAFDHFKSDDLSAVVLNIDRSHRILKLCAKSGTGFAQLRDWAASSEPPFAMSQAHVGELVQAARRQQGAAWKKTGRDVRDDLRAKQRDALVAALLGARVARDTYNLSAYLLLDVEMSPCQLTSRLKQATSSVQTFVQRVGLGLEPITALGAGVAQLSEDAVAEWEWRKNYRVWEANRKVFLHAENWIEPELRMDKTPLFEVFESRLRQGELTDATVLAAVQEYVHGLEEVASLDIRAVCEERDGSHVTMHVVARTRGCPYKYFYRRQVCNRWSPWTALDIGIEGDHLLLRVFYGRLHAFWLSFVERGEKVNGVDKHWIDSTLCWSSYTQGLWERAQRVPAPATLSEKSPQQTDVSLGFVLSGQYEPNQVVLFRSGTSNRLVARFLVLSRHVRVLESTNTPLPYFGIVDVLGALFGDQTSAGELAQEQERWVGEGRLVVQWLAGDLLRLPEELRVRGFSIVTPETIPLMTDGGRAFFVDAERVYLLERLQARTESAGPIRERPDDPQDTAEVNRLVGALDWTTLLHTDWLTSDTLVQSVPQLSQLANAARALGQLRANPVVQSQSQLGSRALVNPISLPNASPSPQANLVKVSLAATSAAGATQGRFQVNSHYHPWASHFAEVLEAGGTDALFGRGQSDLLRQTLAMPSSETFVGRYRRGLDPNAVTTHDDEGIDFSSRGAYAMYNWELFFHVPLLIADRLFKARRFEQAQKALHYVFDPRASGSGAEGRPRDFWKFRPFHQQTYGSSTGATAQPTRELLAAVGAENPLVLAELASRVAAWLENPFEPHAIARVNVSIYQRYVVMRYCDVLIEWGDSLFAQESLESLNEAAQLYMIAAQILGRKPEQVQVSSPEPQTTASIVDASSSPLAFELPGCLRVSDASVESGILTLSAGFCAPVNDWLIKQYWGRVADRLFKVRHCLDLEGRFRQLPLFAPPIDPALLVRARAAGIDFRDVLANLNSPPPHHRYQILIQRALDLTGEVRSLGAALLAAIEKKEAEYLGVLRAEQELELLEMGIELRHKAVEEAAANRAVLEGNRDSAQSRARHYAQLMTGADAGDLEMDPSTVGGPSDELSYRNAHEEKARKHEVAAKDLSEASGALGIVQGIVAAIPNFKVGVTDPGATFGGQDLSAVVGTFVQYLRLKADLNRAEAGLTQTENQLIRRHQDWHLQLKSALFEHQSVNRQLVAAEIRESMAVLERSNAELQRDHALTRRDFLRTQKFTNEQLYQFQVDQLTTLYFQTYQLALSLAKQAEGAWKRELGIADVSFIGFNYWDRARAGLLAGERLFHDLKRMETAYLEHAGRELQLSSHWSLRLLNPLALTELRTTGVCSFNIPEELYDLDTPGHYFRRIKQVSISIPAVAGPYVPVRATLELSGSKVRKTDTIGEAPVDAELPAIRAIVTSHGQNDTGLFDPSGGDGRYLPFEGAGAVSSWHLKLPEVRQFDYAVISDVVVHVQYTARRGSDAFAAAQLQAARQGFTAALRGSGNLGGKDGSGEIEGLFHAFGLKRDFSTEWHRLLSESGAATTESGAAATEGAKIQVATTLSFDRSMLPYAFLTAESIDVSEVLVVAVPKPGTKLEIAVSFLPEGDLTPVDQPLESARFVLLTVPKFSLLTTSGGGLGTSVLPVRLALGGNQKLDSLEDFLVIPRFVVNL